MKSRPRACPPQAVSAADGAAIPLDLGPQSVRQRARAGTLPALEASGWPGDALGPAVQFEHEAARRARGLRLFAAGDEKAAAFDHNLLAVVVAVTVGDPDLVPVWKAEHDLIQRHGRLPPFEPRGNPSRLDDTIPPAPTRRPTGGMRSFTARNRCWLRALFSTEPEGGSAPGSLSDFGVRCRSCTNPPLSERTRNGTRSQPPSGLASHHRCRTLTPALKRGS